MHLAAMLDSKNLAKMKGSGSNDQWDDSYARLYKLPKYWLANLICKFSDLSSEDMDLMDSCDHGAVRQVFEFFMQVKSNDQLPRPMLDKAVCAETLVERAKQVGSRPMRNNYITACSTLPLPR
jgi:hypothetical protein